jgi:hypothetical protein
MAAKWRDEHGVRAVFVDLTAVDIPDHVMPAIRRAIGITDSEGGEPHDEVVLLAAAPHLLLIDNFEQVADAAHRSAACCRWCTICESWSPAESDCESPPNDHSCWMH